MLYTSGSTAFKGIFSSSFFNDELEDDDELRWCFLSVGRAGTKLSSLPPVIDERFLP